MSSVYKRQVTEKGFIMKTKDLVKAIINATETDIKGLWKYLSFSEKEDIKILCERKNLKITPNNIKKILIHNHTLLKAVYSHAESFEKEDLQALACR